MYSRLCSLLFFIRIGNTAEQDDRVKLGEAEIQGLFFADDIVLIAESKENLQKLLVILASFTKERKSEINPSKSKIIKKEKKGSKDNVWTLRKGRGTAQCYSLEISEANSYKYIGIELSNKRLLQSHGKKTQKMPRLIGLLKHKALRTPSKKIAAYNIWRQMVRPLLIYGAEVVPLL